MLRVIWPQNLTLSKSNHISGRVLGSALRRSSIKIRQGWEINKPTQSPNSGSNSVPYLWFHLPRDRKLKGVNKWIAKLLCLTTKKRMSLQALLEVYWCLRQLAGTPRRKFLSLNKHSGFSKASQDLWVRTGQAGPPVQLPSWSPFCLHTSHPSLPGPLIPALDRMTLIMMILTSGSLPHPSIDSGAVTVSPISLSDGSPLTVCWSWSYTPGASASPR